MTCRTAAPCLRVIVYLVALFTAAAQAQGQQPLQAPLPLTPIHNLPIPSQAEPLDFRLRSIFHHGTSPKYRELHRRLDVDDGTIFSTSDGLVHTLRDRSPYIVKSRSINIQRLVDRPSLTTYHNNDYSKSWQVDAWTEDKVSAPDITDKKTVISFARMALDAYVEVPGTGNWQDVGSGFNYTEHFGWEGDGLRGHVYADTKNQTVIIAMKGTSLPFIDPIGSITNDKTNDNLLFSCCCGYGGWWLWQKVCNCQTEKNVCNSTCLAEETRDKTMYFYAAQELYRNVTKEYPHADIWLTGHSLGGSVASLLGLSAGNPAVTFEAPAEAMAAHRLGLPHPPGFQLGTQGHKRASTGGYHFGHTADDIFMGNCNSWNSVCTIGGYAMESRCHSGQVCKYDTVKDLGWAPNARSYHGIALVLKDVIEAYDELPDCKPQPDCTDCDEWKFTNNDTESSRIDLY